MNRNIYIKFILTVIALELGIFLFRMNTPQTVIVNPGNNHAAAVQTKYDLSNTGYKKNQDEPTKVVIVDIDMKNWGYPYTKMLPVSLCKEDKTKGASRLQAVSYPLPVTNEK